MIYEIEHRVASRSSADEAAEMAADAVRSYLRADEANPIDGAQVDIQIRKLTDKELREEMRGISCGDEENERYLESVRKVTVRVGKPHFKLFAGE